MDWFDNVLKIWGLKEEDQPAPVESEEPPPAEPSVDLEAIKEQLGTALDSVVLPQDSLPAAAAAPIAQAVASSVQARVLCCPGGVGGWRRSAPTANRPFPPLSPKPQTPCLPTY